MPEISTYNIQACNLQSNSVNGNLNKYYLNNVRQLESDHHEIERLTYNAEYTLSALLS